jgi:hypothetical protein
VGCSGTENCEDPANPTTCANTEIYGDGYYCDTCPAGYSCSGGSPSRCNASNLNKYSARGDGSCSTNSDRDKLIPAPEYGSILSCPTDTFRTTASSANYCEVCPAGKSCSAGASSYTGCTSGQTQSGLGDTSCQDNTGFPGFKIDGSGKNDVDMTVCAQGEYISTNSNSCSTCGINKYCDFTQEQSCASDQYSPSGTDYCIRAPYGQAVKADGTTESCAGPTQYLNGDTCASCPSGEICNALGERGTCQAGYYIDDSNVCQQCVAGTWCPDGIYYYDNSNSGSDFEVSP